MEIKEDKRDSRPADIPGLINPDGKPIVELLDEAFGPVPETGTARRRTIGEIYTHKKATDEMDHLHGLSLKFGIPFLPELPVDPLPPFPSKKSPVNLFPYVVFTATCYG